MRIINFSSLFNLYYLIRMKCPFRSYFNWLIFFIYIVQFSFIYISCLKPYDIFHTSENASIWMYIEACFLYPPWIFGTSTLLTDSIFFFSICVIPFLIISYSQVHIKKFSNQKHVNFWCALVIRICQQFLTPFITVPIVFRFSYLIEQLFILREQIEFKIIFSFVICCANLILQIFHTYMSALFLVPIDFVFNSKANFYDGKYMTNVYVIRMAMAVVCFELHYISNSVVAAIVISIVFFVCFLTLYFRLTIQVHVSAIGQYLETLPFFACPFIVLFNYFVHNETYSFLMLIFLYIVYGVFFSIHTYFIVRASLKAFSPFMGQNNGNNVVHCDMDNVKIVLPKFFIGSIISVIRIVSTHYSDPDYLLCFLAFQRRSTSSVKNSSIIEVVRFLALFPSRRKEALKLLRDCHSKSNFNSFTIFIFKKILKSLIKIESTKKNLVCLNNFYRSFLVHKHLYWVSRKNKKRFIAAREALSAAYFFIEVKNEFHYLLKRYTYDSFLHYYYADFCLSACGDFEGYLNECQIARMLDSIFYSSNNNNNKPSNDKNNRNSINSNNSASIDDEIETHSIVDPLLHPMSIVNPKILQFCSLEETRIKYHSPKNEIMKNNKNEKSLPVATFVNRTKHLIPLLSIFHIYVPMALFLYVISELYMKDQQIHLKSDELYNTSVNLVNVFYVASSTVFIPYLSHIFLNGYDENKTLDSFNYFNQRNRLKQILTMKYNDIFSIDEKSIDIFINFPFYVIDFYSQIKQLGNLTGSVIFTIEQYVSKRMFNNYTIPDILDKIPYELDYSIQVVFHEVYKKLIEISNNAINLREMYKSDLNSYYICKVAIITICAFAVLSSIVYIIQINVIDITDKTKINFLSSESVFSLFLQQESKKAWDQLKLYTESSSDIQLTSSCQNSARSSVDLTNSNIVSTTNNLNSINILEINENKPNQIETDNIEETLLEMAVNGRNFNKDLRSLVNSNNYIKIKKDSNFKIKFPYRKQNNIGLNELEDHSEINYVDKTESEENENIENNEINIDDAYICNQAITIAKATEKEAFFSGPYFHLVILLSAPLIFAVVVISMFQAPLSLVAYTNEETFQNILNGESMANHSLILLNATFYILQIKLGFTGQISVEMQNKFRKVFYKSIDFHETHNHFDHNFVRNFDSMLNRVFLKNGINRRINKNQFRSILQSNKNRNRNGNRKTRKYEEIKGYEEIISNLVNLSSYKEEKCYEFNEIVCMSVEKAIDIAFTNETLPSIIATECIPLVYLFTWNLFQDLFFSSVKDLFLMKISNGTCFVVSTVLLMLTIVHISFSSSLLLKKAFNSLFHFPSDFLRPPNEKSKNNSTNNKGRLPQNALVVTSITESDEIYSVSSNSKEIINRNLNDLISLKMSETFPKVSQDCIENDLLQLCEFAITDKVKKLFRYSTEQIGCLTKTILIEENSSYFENSREKSLLQRMNAFIPPHFAELYVKNNQSEFIYSKNFIISVRISNEISVQMIEKCFNAANHISQYSISLDIISVDGEMIIFSSTSNCKLIIVFLLIRDFIDLVVKNTKIQNCIYSIFVHFMDYFSIDVIDDVEPYLEFHPYNINFFKFKLFQIENGQIAFSENFESLFPSIIKITEKQSIQIDFDGNIESVRTIPIANLESKVTEFV